MWYARLVVVAVPAFVGSVLPLNGAAASATIGFTVEADSVLRPPRAPAFWTNMSTAAQDPPAVETSLGLDRSTRRLVQYELNPRPLAV